MRPIARLTVAVLGALALSACATTSVGSFVERNIELGHYRTYTWGPADGQATGDPRLDNNEFFEERVQDAVEGHLNVRGFVKTESAVPDLLVHFYANVSQEVDPDGVDRPYATCEECKPFVFDTGTIVVDLVDAHTHRLVWRGWAKGNIDGVVDNQSWMEKRVDETVERILEQLPPGMGRVS